MINDNIPLALFISLFYAKIQDGLLGHNHFNDHFIGFGSVYEIINNEMVQTVTVQLGYPFYLASLHGVTKLLGVMTILYRKWPKVIEWA